MTKKAKAAKVIYADALPKERKRSVIDRELNAILEEDGKVTIDAVLERARQKSNPLHKYFEWNDSKAAEQWRRHQAHQMIMASKFVVQLQEAKAPPQDVKASVEVRRLVAPFRGEGFRMRNEALADESAREKLVKMKLRELKSWCKSVVDISELDSIRKSIEKLI